MPCQSSIVAIYQALEDGNLDLPLRYTPEGASAPSTLRQLAALPFQHTVGKLAQSTKACINAMTFMKADGDACHLSMLNHTGALVAYMARLAQHKSAVIMMHAQNDLQPVPQ